MRGFLQTGLWTKGRLLSRRCLPKIGLCFVDGRVSF